MPDVFTDIEDLLEFDELDAVIITTPNHLHERSLSALHPACMCSRAAPRSPLESGTDPDGSAARVSEVFVALNHRFRSDVQALDVSCAVVSSAAHWRRSGHYQVKKSVDSCGPPREAGGGAFFENGLPLLDLALWLADFPDPVRVSAQMERGRGASAVEDSMFVYLECAQGMSLAFDVTWSYVGDEDRWWFEVLASRGNARLAPLRVVKELNGKPMDVSPGGAAARESAFIQSYRAELAHFVAILREESAYEPPAEQITLHRVAEAIYKSADEGKEIRL